MEKEPDFNKPKKEQFDCDKIRSMLNSRSKKSILEQIEEDPYKSELRNEIDFIFSNLDRAISYSLADREEIKEAVKESLSGEKDLYLSIKLTAEKKEKISKIIIDMIVESSKIEN